MRQRAPGQHSPGQEERAALITPFPPLVNDLAGHAIVIGMNKKEEL